MNIQSKEEIFITNSFEETQKLGEDFAKGVQRPGLARLQGLALKRQAFVVAFYGDLGAGKTTFVQGLAKGLGIKKRIISPTFIIVRSYAVNSTYLYHIDLYRIENRSDIDGLGIEEILKNPENIVVVEWAERLGDLLPKKRIDVYFEYIGQNKRKIIYDFRY